MELYITEFIPSILEVTKACVKRFCWVFCQIFPNFRKGLNLVVAGLYDFIYVWPHGKCRVTPISHIAPDGTTSQSHYKDDIQIINTPKCRASSQPVSCYQLKCFILLGKLMIWMVAQGSFTLAAIFLLIILAVIILHRLKLVCSVLKYNTLIQYISHCSWIQYINIVFE